MQFEVRVAHVARRMSTSLSRQFAIAERFVRGLAQPRFQMHFVDRDRLAQQVALGARSPSTPASPQVYCSGSRRWTRCAAAPRRRRRRDRTSPAPRPTRERTQVFVMRAWAQARDEQLPTRRRRDAAWGGWCGSHSLKSPMTRDVLGVGRPDRETHAVDAVARTRCAPSDAITLVMRAFGVEVQFEGCQGRRTNRLLAHSLLWHWMPPLS